MLFFGAIAAAVIGCWLYVKGLQKDLAIAKENMIKMEQAHEAQQKVIAQQRLDFETIVETNRKINETNKTLQGFTKFDIDANESKDVEIKLLQRNFSYWSVDTNTWQIKGGSYQIYIGSSSQNISLKSVINLEPVLEVL